MRDSLKIASFVLFGLASLLASPIIVAAQTPPVAAGPAVEGNRRCFFCHGREEFKEKKRRDGRKGLYVAAGEFRASIHGKRLCRECHADAVQIPHVAGLERVQCTRCHFVGNVVGAPESRRYRQYEESVHGRLAASGDVRAPWCQDCHGTHEIRPADDTESQVHRTNIPDDCGRCHEKPKREYDRSIHAGLLAEGNMDTPVCTDCHSEHQIRRPGDPDSTVHPSHVIASCARCHEDEQIMKRYGQDVKTVATFKGSFHGVALKFGMLQVASCTSCHSYHAVIPKEDPRSTVHPSNLAKTCGKVGCHPGATDNFAKGRIHISAKDRSAGTVYWVATGFTYLTVSVMAGLVLHILLDLGGHFLRRRRRDGQETGSTDDEQEEAGLETILATPLKRLDPFVRVQHFCMAVSVILLVVTGIPVKFHEAGWAVSMMDALGGLTVTGWVHRLAAAILIAVSVAHVLYITLAARGRRNFLSMFPRPADARQLFQNLAYFVGLREERPFFDRFSYLEKFDYWAVYWGIVIMVGSGLVLWFETAFMQFVPKEMVDIAKEMHSDEAMLATLAILIWHFYNAHFNPDKFPMNPVFWHGRTNLEDMLEEHPMELAKRVRHGRVDRRLLDAVADRVPRAREVLEVAFPGEGTDTRGKEV